MKQLTGNQVRQMFLDYFEQHGHMIEPGASLVPHNDPTLLWINAGVAALKKYFDAAVELTDSDTKSGTLISNVRLKKELEWQLIEYQRAKEAAKNLAALYQPSAVFVRRPAPVRSDPVFRGTASPKKLREAYILAFGKAGRRLPPPAEAFNGIVNRRFVSVTSRIVWLLRRLYRDGRAEYQALFQSGERSELVATFLAVLELVKSGRVSISDDNRTVFLNKRREAGERR